MSDEIDDNGLTAEEQAALGYGLEDDENVDANAAPAAEAAPTADDAPAVDPDADAAPADAAPVAEAEPAAAAAEPAPEAEPVPAAAPEPAPQKVAVAPAPVLIAEAPADAQAKLDKIANDKADIAEKYENGDMTFKEYQKQLDVLNNDQFELKSQLRDAETAKRLNAQSQQNAWDADCRTFLDGHKEYHDEAGKERLQALDEAIKAMARMPVNKGISGPALLDKAHRMVKAAYGETVVEPVKAAAKPAHKQLDVPKPAIPPTNIGKLPASDGQDAQGGEFSALNALLKGDNVEEFEAAYERLTPSQRNRYLQQA